MTGNGNGRQQICQVQYIALSKLQGEWERGMHGEPQYALDYFCQRFDMRTTFKFNPRLQGYGRAHPLSWRGVLARIPIGFLKLLPVQVQIGVTAFEKGNHWVELVLQMFHEERHQMDQGFMQYVSRNPWYEVDAWDYAFEQAKRHGIDEQEFRLQFMYWRNNLEGNRSEWRSKWGGEVPRTLWERAVKWFANVS